MPPRRARQPGLLVAFEGIDGSGKTLLSQTLCRMLEAEGVANLWVREPGGTEFAEGLRDTWEKANLHDATSSRVEALLFNAARAHLVEKRIRPALAAGTVVVCDRFADSTVAYQGSGTGLDMDELIRLNHFATAGLVPDLVILLDVPASVGLSRKAGMQPANGHLSSMEMRGAAFLDRVRGLYLALAAGAPNRWEVLDGGSEASELLPRIWARVKALLERRQTASAGRSQSQLL